jgi:hypothetical protein
MAAFGSSSIITPLGSGLLVLAPPTPPTPSCFRMMKAFGVCDVEEEDHGGKD